MPIQVFGAQAAVSMVNRALANTSPSHSIYLNQVAEAGETADSQYAFAALLGAQFAVGKTAAQLSAQLLDNIGVSNAILQAALTDYITAHGTQNIGIIALQLGRLISGLEGDATFGDAAVQWNQEVTNAYQYSVSSVNNTPQTGDDAAASTNLTRFTDVLTGHDFKGYLDYNQFSGKDEQTLSTGDRLTGTDAADDMLHAQLLGAPAIMVFALAPATPATRPTLNGIEIVSIDAKGNNTELDLSDANGVKTLINAGSAEAATLTFSNLKNLVDVVIRDTSADTSVDFNATVVAGVADLLKLQLEGAGVAADRADFTANGIETLNITTAVKASVLGNVTSAALTTLTIAGNQNLSVGTKAAATGFLGTQISTVNASAATGNLFLNLAASAARDQTVTTGSGNDVVVTGSLTAADTFTLGAGNDRLVLTVAGTNQAAKLLGVEEVEARATGTNLNLTNAPDVKLLAVAQDASFANVTAVKSGTSVVFEGRGLENAVSGSAVVFGGVVYNLASATGTNDVIDFKLNNAGVALGANRTVSIGALTNTGDNVETIHLAFSDVGATNTVNVADINVGTALKTLTVASNSKVVLGNVNDLGKLTSVDASGVKAGFTATFGALGDAAAATIKLGGSGVNNLSVSKANDGAAGAVKLLTVDGSAGTGNQTITITGNADVSSAVATTAAQYAAKASVSVLGGAGNDSINVTSNAGGVTLIKGGAGADAITLIGGTFAVEVLVFAAGDSTSANKDVVQGFSSGTDKIDLSAFGFDAALAQLGTAVAALSGNAGEFGGKAAAAFSTGGSTTVYVDLNGDNKLDAADLVVLLSGTAAVSAGDFLFI